MELIFIFFFFILFPYKENTEGRIWYFCYSLLLLLLLFRNKYIQGTLQTAIKDKVRANSLDDMSFHLAATGQDHSANDDSAWSSEDSLGHKAINS